MLKKWRQEDKKTDLSKLEKNNGVKLKGTRFVRPPFKCVVVLIQQDIGTQVITCVPPPNVDLHSPPHSQCFLAGHKR